MIGLLKPKMKAPEVRGWTGKTLWVDLTRATSRVEETHPQQSLLVGGRGFNVDCIFRRLRPGDTAFDPDNLLCIAPGVLTGTPAPASARTAISALSPRGLLDTASIGGFIGAEIKFAGYDQIVITGQAAHPTYLFVHNDQIHLKNARHLWGRDPWQTQQAIRKELGDRDIQSLAIGVAGENRVHFAAVLTGRLTSAAGRCGMGAVMGAKNLKAVAVRGTGAVTPADPQKLLAACAELRETLQASAIFEARRGCASDKSVYRRHLTEGGKFVAGNWEETDWEADGFTRLLADPEPFWKEHAQQLQAGGARQPGCFGCPMYHETFFDLPSSGDIGRTKCVEWLSFSGTAWLTDRHRVNHAAHQCNRLGLDAVSAGSCIAFLMQLYHEGVISRSDTDGTAMRRGDLQAVEVALTKIAHQEGFGKWFQAGVGGAAAVIGPKAQPFAIQIKKLELMPEEIRAYKGLALQTAVGKTEWYLPFEYGWGSAPQEMQQQAADFFGDADLAVPTTYDGKGRMVWDAENRHCAGDLLGICKLLVPWGFSQSLEWPARLLRLATGIVVDEQALLQAAQRVLLLERSFNYNRGIRRRDEVPPNKFFEVPVPAGRFKGEVLHREQYDRLLDEYYRLRGCNSEGAPQAAAFRALGLDEHRHRFEKTAGKTAHFKKRPEPKR